MNHSTRHTSPFWLFFFCCLFAFVELRSQDTLANRSAARELAKSSYSAFAAQLELGFSSWDAFTTKADRNAYKQLDSLLHAEDFLQAGMQVPIEVDRFYSYLEKNDARYALYSLRLIRTSLEKFPLTDAAYAQVMARTLAPKARALRDYETASLLYAMSGSSASPATPAVNLEPLQRRVDSLQTALNEHLAKPSPVQGTTSSAESHTPGWAWAVLVLLVITWVVLIVFARKSKAIRESVQAKLDEVLSDDKHKQLEKKMELVENEAYEFRKTAQATVEKLNGMDNARRRVLAAVDVLDEDVTKGFEEMKEVMESHKSNMKPTEYMAISNANSRFSTAVQQRILLLRDRLKAW